ncbi:MAG: DMT family transporter, partial [Bacteroidota bacterium]
FNIGDGLTLICAAVFGLYIVYLDVFTKQYHVGHLTFLQFVSTGIICAVSALLFEDMVLALTTNLLLGVAYLAVLATVVTLAIQTRYQKDTTPTRAAIIFSLEPVIAAILAYLVRGEEIGSLGVLGGGLIVTGLLVSELSDVIFPRNRQRGS